MARRRLFRLMPRPLVLALLIVALAGPADAQLLGRRSAPPPVLTPEEAAVWPFPPPDPAAWWTEDRTRASEAADPLGGRRLRRGERLGSVDNGVDPSTYRLWGLMPLQWQAVRDGEMVMEVWVRPARSVRQSVVRITLRRDDRAFVQGRAGLACCEAGIARRVGFDAELPAGAAARLRALRADPVWSAPRDVRVAEGGGAAEAICVDGVSYDLTLLIAGQARTVRRACDSAEIGQAAEVLEAVVGAALGHEPRFDVALPRGADFAQARRAYQDLVRQGGALRPDRNAPPQPPSLASPAEEERPTAAP